MKKLSLIGIATLLTTMLSACGGGGGSTGSASIAPSTPPPASATGIIYDSGRGTINNQDMENSKN